MMKLNCAYLALFGLLMPSAGGFRFAPVQIARRTAIAQGFAASACLPVLRCAKTDGKGAGTVRVTA